METIRAAKHYVTQWRWWIRGLVSAAVSGGANAVTIMIIKPQDFNFESGLTDLWHFTLVSALVATAIWLKANPVPPRTVEGESVPPI